MKRLLRSLALGMTGALLVVASTEGADREHQQMMADIRMLQEQMSQLRLMMGTLDETLQEISQAVLTRLDTLADESRRAVADQTLQVGNLSGSVRIVREKVDEANVRISSVAQEVEALRLAIPRMSTPLTRLAVDPETGLPTASVQIPAPAAVAPVNPGVSPQRMYDSAWADFAAGQYALSIQGFEAYLGSFPQSEQADDAQFFIGENFFSDGQYPEAAEAYEQVVLRYADGTLVPEALYKRGLTFIRLDQPELARQAFERVVQNHSESNMANLAQQQLDNMDREP